MTEPEQRSTMVSLAPAGVASEVEAAMLARASEGVVVMAAPQRVTPTIAVASKSRRRRVEVEGFAVGTLGVIVVLLCRSTESPTAPEVIGEPGSIRDGSRKIVEPRIGPDSAAQRLFSGGAHGTRPARAARGPVRGRLRAERPRG